MENIAQVTGILLTQSDLPTVLGLFLFIAGFITGLGAVTVIDTLGFLGRKSVYWTEATIRAHKVTKPLIWLGIILAAAGGFIFYSNQPGTPVMMLHAVLFFVLVCNGCFLSFYVSPFLLRKEQQETGKKTTLLPQQLQIKIAISFIFSFLGWWSALLILVLYLVSRMDS